MAKRTRGSNRPGQRRADRRSGRPQPQATSRPAGLSQAEESQAAELESAIVAQERSAAERGRDRGRAAEAVRLGRTAGPGLLAVKAAEEYAYVVRDVRRIILVGGAMAATLAVLYVLIDVAHLVTIS